MRWIVLLCIATSAFGADLRFEVQRLAEREPAPFWVGYEVPLVEGVEGFCCLPGVACVLPSYSESMLQGRTSANAPHPQLKVLLRIEKRKVTRIRSFTTDCDVNAAGERLFWLRDVTAADSVSLLRAYLDAKSAVLTNEAMWTIGAHAGSDADEALIAHVRTAQPAAREDALSRIGNVRGRKGFEFLRNWLDETPDVRLRKELLLAIEMSHEHDAANVLLRFAREDGDAAVRKWARFLYDKKTAALSRASNPAGADRHAPARKGGGNDRGVARVQ